jgi:hypothetical protein
MSPEAFYATGNHLIATEVVPEADALTIDEKQKSKTMEPEKNTI